MGLEAGMLEKLKISSLLHDIGKIATPKEILNKNGKLERNEWDEIKRHPGRGADILVELKQFKEIIQRSSITTSTGTDRTASSA